MCAFIRDSNIPEQSQYYLCEAIEDSRGNARIPPLRMYEKKGEVRLTANDIVWCEDAKAYHKVFVVGAACILWVTNGF